MRWRDFDFGRRGEESGRALSLGVRSGGLIGAEFAVAWLPRGFWFGRNSYLVDPASSHMLVSKIKPCMCKYKLFCTVKLRMAH